MLWLHAKHAAGLGIIVAAELGKLHQHLLAPLGITAAPSSLGHAVTAYRTARATWEQQPGFQVPRAAEQTVTHALHL